MIVGIGLSCFAMAFVLFAADPFDYHPDPFLQAVVWVGFGVWCLATAWQQRNWRPPPDES
ncbi:hypothetical protein [Mesorhizobium sp. M1405]|uniref:hypothetical protein n=1 Tax=unclassified Mesorhizobium TaxID=325217 RepID=UPI003335B656